MRAENILVLSKEYSTNTQLDAIGFGAFTNDQLQDAFRSMITAIAIGTNRSGQPTTQDGGVPAIPSPVEPITTKDLSAAPQRTRAFGIIFGGTNQQSAIVEKGPQDAMVTMLNRKPVDRKEKTVTLEGFSELIAKHLMDGVDSETDPRSTIRGIQALGVSLGIPQINTESDRRSDGSIDARPWGEPSNWRFTDYDPTRDDPRISLATPLKKRLNDQGFDIETVVFQPDPTAVAHDVPYHNPDSPVLPASILAGTGTNASLRGVDLQLSTTSDMFPRDLITEKMIEKGYMPNQNLTKFRTGGHRIKLRVAAAMHVLADKGKLGKEAADMIEAAMQDKQNGPLLTQIASGELAWNEFNKYYATSLTPNEYEIVRMSSKKALDQAGQVIGVMIAAVATMAGYDGISPAQLPMEGSVLKKGHRVLQVVRETVRKLLPDNQIHLHHASDLTGVAKLTMLRYLQSKNQPQ